METTVGKKPKPSLAIKTLAMN